ncbi:MAG TPA: response regulator, partial [Armatimonadota bacterium]
TRLRQVATNLIGNAIKFTEVGEVCLQVHLESEEPTHAVLRCEVTDTGIGIPESRRGRIFRSFSQVDASTTRRYGGTGLGLAISKQLAELMGGAIGFESQEGKASRFWFTVRLEKQASQAAATGRPPESIHGARVLVVDDNETNRLVLRQQLRSWGCLSEESAGAVEGLTKLRAAAAAGMPFQLALLDLQMPEVDGESLLEEILADTAIKDTPLVVLTSLGDSETANRLRDKGAVAVLSKPVKQSHLHNCLMDAMGAAPAPSTPSVPAAPAPETAPATKRRLLVAEDNRTNQLVIRTILAKNGYEVKIASTGLEVLELVEASSYDLVLMDVQMPEMDGLEATTELRRREEGTGRHLPIVAMTAHAMKGDREECLEAGMDDYVSKPIQPLELLQALNRILGSDPSPG